MTECNLNTNLELCEPIDLTFNKTDEQVSKLNREDLTASPSNTTHAHQLYGQPEGQSYLNNKSLAKRHQKKRLKNRYLSNEDSCSTKDLQDDLSETTRSSFQSCVEGVGTSTAVPLVLMMQGPLQSATQQGNTSMSLFRCNMCDIISTKLIYILSHVANDHSSFSYCSVCKEFQDSDSERALHNQTCQKGQPTHSVPLTMTNSNLERANSFAREDSPNPPMNGYSTSQNDQPERKKKGQYPKNSFNCTYCNKTFLGQFYLQRHLRSHTGEKSCFCDICGKGFVEWRNLKNHMIRFHKNYKNVDTSAQCKSTSSLNHSSDSNEGDLGLTWSKPGQSLPPMASTSAASSPAQEYPSLELAADVSSCPRPKRPQLLILEGDKDKTEQADLIAAGGTNALDFVTAIDSPTHSEKIKSNTASLGSKSSRLILTKDNDDVIESLNPVCSTQGQKFFQCRLCTKTFRTKFAMRRHIDFHTDKRPFQCDQCDYKAKTKPQLKVHALRHSGEKEFRCEICCYACVTHSDLNRHCKSRTHRFRVALMEQQKNLSTTNK